MNKKYATTGYGTTVDAVYTEPKISSDKGNLMIMALPEPISNLNDIIATYTKGLPSYSYARDVQLPRMERRFLVPQLRSLRIYLPFESTLEMEFYNALTASYRLRELSRVDAVVPYTKLVSPTGAATNAGFALLGYSGCGKSSAIALLASHYPQVIKHHLPDGTVLSQILYIVVSCNSTHNFSELYGSIGREIDKALHLDIYENMINKTQSLGKKKNKVIELIERFAIGICILDEIQQLSFSETNTNTYESLLTIANTTKIAMGAVGTEDGYAKMFSVLRTARRLGREIPAVAYCDNLNYFIFVMKRLFEYQWLDKPLALTEEIVDVFYRETHGIIDQAVSLWIAVQDEYLQKKKHFTITAKFVSSVFTKRYPHMRELLSSIELPENDEKIAEILKEANLKHEHDLEIEKQNMTMSEIVTNEEIYRITMLVQSVTAAIRNVDKRSTDEEIETACKEVIKDMPPEQRTCDNVAPLVNEKLQKKQAPKLSRTVSSQDMLNSILQN